MHCGACSTRRSMLPNREYMLPFYLTSLDSNLQPLEAKFADACFGWRSCAEVGRRHRPALLLNTADYDGWRTFHEQTGWPGGQENQPDGACQLPTPCARAAQVVAMIQIVRVVKVLRCELRTCKETSCPFRSVCYWLCQC